MVQNTAFLDPPPAITADQEQSCGRTLVFVDTNVENRQSLLANIPVGAKVVVLEPSSNGIAQITKAIQAAPIAVASIHIFSHGQRAPGTSCLT